MHIFPYMHVQVHIDIIGCTPGPDIMAVLNPLYFQCNLAQHINIQDRCVQQCEGYFPHHIQPGFCNDQCDHDTCNYIYHRVACLNCYQTADNANRYEDITSGVEGIGDQYLAVIFPALAAFKYGDKKVNGHGTQHDGKTQCGDPGDRRFVYGLNGTPGHFKPCDEQQAGYEQRGELLMFAMPVRVGFIRRSGRHPDTQHTHSGRCTVHQGMETVGLHADGAGQVAVYQLCECYYQVQ